MAQASHRVRLRRRLKRKASLAIQQFRKVEQARMNAATSLCMVLAQQGGDMTLSKGTVEQVITNLNRLSYSVTRSVDGEGQPTGEYVLKLVEAAQDAPVAGEDARTAPISVVPAPEAVVGQ
jgi:hypothetical protein